MSAERSTDLPTPVHNTHRDNIRAAELRQLDHWPTCPRCGDLSQPDSGNCEGCGYDLLRKSHTVGPVSDQWQDAR